MLKLVIPALEYWDERNQEFVTMKKDYTLRLEHSLISISKWEAKWHKAYIGDKNRTEDQALDYIRCMSLDGDPPPEVYIGFRPEHIKQINDYIDDPMTATYIPHFKTEGTGRRGDAITSELIYYWMVSYQIPVQFEKWHLNRLMTLIDVFNAKSKKQKKRPIRDIAEEYAKINAERRKKLGTTG